MVSPLSRFLTANPTYDLVCNTKIREDVDKPACMLCYLADQVLSESLQGRSGDSDSLLQSTGFSADWATSAGFASTENDSWSPRMRDIDRSIFNTLTQNISRHNSHKSTTNRSCECDYVCTCNPQAPQVKSKIPKREENIIRTRDMSPDKKVDSGKRATTPKRSSRQSMPAMLSKKEPETTLLQQAEVRSPSPLSLSQGQKGSKDGSHQLGDSGRAANKARRSVSPPSMTSVLPLDLKEPIKFKANGSEGALDRMKPRVHPVRLKRSTSDANLSNKVLDGIMYFVTFRDRMKERILDLRKSPLSKRQTDFLDLLETLLDRSYYLHGDLNGGSVRKKT